MFYVYILFSERSDKFYVGHSSDPERRLIEHNTSPDDPERRLIEHNTSPELKYTSKFSPWKISLIIKVSEYRGDAIIVERFIKKQKNRLFLLRLINEKGNDEYFCRLISKAVGQSDPEDSGLIRRS